MFHRLFGKAVLRVSHFSSVSLQNELQFGDLDINFFMITLIGSLYLSFAVRCYTNKLLDLDNELSENVVPNILVYVHHEGRNSFDLAVVSFTAFIYKPRQNFRPV